MEGRGNGGERENGGGGKEDRGERRGRTETVWLKNQLP